MKDDLTFDPARLHLRLLNAEIRLKLIEAGKWPAPPGWALKPGDLGLEEEPEGFNDGEGIAERLRQALDARRPLARL